MAVTERAVTEQLAGTVGEESAGAAADPFPDALGEALAVTALSLARRVQGGASLWCLAPSWPHHARHLAVEFVHPVVMGARALPAVAIVDDDPVATLRALAHPGDVVLAIGLADEPALFDALRRATVWGLATDLVGAGSAPPPGAADHVLWLADPHGESVHDGRLTLLYHVLWELTHVCFEHPGLLRPDDGDRGDNCHDGACAVCADQGVLGEVVSVGAEGSALVRTARGLEWADVTLVAPLGVHDLVLLHAGTALAVVP